MIQELLNNKVEREKVHLWRLLWKLIKIGVFLFFLVTTLWGCGQQIFDHNVISYNGPGSGFEICNNPKYCFNNHNFDNKGGQIFFEYITNFNQAIKLGPFYGLFVWPLAMLTTLISQGISKNQYGIPSSASTVITILIIVLVIRGIVTVFSVKQFGQQIIMQQIQPKIAKIKAKYEGKTSMEFKQKMQMEILALNRKYGVNPLGALASTFVTLPFFYSMYRVFSELRIFKDNWIFKPEYKLVLTPFTAIFHDGYWIYLIFVVILIPIQIFSFKLPTLLARRSQGYIHMNDAAKKQYKKNQTMLNVMMIVFALMAFILPLSIEIYWIFSGIYTICQSYLVWKNNQKHLFKNKNFKNRLKSKEKLKAKDKLKLFRLRLKKQYFDLAKINFNLV